MSENQNIEYKLSWHDDYLKWICGFANAQGGTLYLGIDDEGNHVNLDNASKLMEDIPNKIRNAMGIICQVDLNKKNDCQFISIDVNPSSVAVSLRGRYYYRSGSTKMELTGSELNGFLLKKTGITWDSQIQENATLDDIDEKILSQFVRDGNEKGRMPNVEGLSTFQILEKLQLTSGVCLTKAAIILFGKNPNKFHPNVELKIGRFGSDSTDLKFHEIIEGNLIHILKEAQVQLNHKFLVRPIEFVGMHRIEKYEYPIEALREMMLNALVHKNYLGAPIQLKVYDDKISLWNEGLLPRGLEAEQLKSEHISQPRNPLIAKACFLAGYIDIWGLGTLKIFKSCKEADLPEPEIVEVQNGVRVTLFKQSKDKNYKISNTPGSQIANPAAPAFNSPMSPSEIHTWMEEVAKTQEKLNTLLEQNPLICNVNTPNTISLKPYNTFGFDVHCREMHTLNHKTELRTLFESGLFARNPKIISGGSNLLLTQNIDVPVIVNRIKGISISRETEEHLYLSFGAGEPWHESVMYAVEHNWGGMENLSLIPGCMGAAPIQNIGAYGVELKDIFHELEAFNIQTGLFETFGLEDCKFGYRDSVFKNEKKNQYIITEVCLKLDKNPQIRTQYGDIQSVLDAQNLPEISIADVSRAVIHIRQSKLPDPAEIGNSGSFFKNPVIPAEQAAALQSQYPGLKSFPQNDKETKIPAAWLIENAGWKGYRRGEVGVHAKQALVLVNYGKGSGAEVHQLAQDIREDVRQKFNITLDFEVNIW